MLQPAVSVQHHAAMGCEPVHTCLQNRVGGTEDGARNEAEWTPRVEQYPSRPRGPFAGVKVRCEVVERDWHGPPGGQGLLARRSTSATGWWRRGAGGPTDYLDAEGETRKTKRPMWRGSFLHASERGRASSPRGPEQVHRGPIRLEAFGSRKLRHDHASGPIAGEELSARRLQPEVVWTTLAIRYFWLWVYWQEGIA
jgi:hypothetical protein